MKILNEKINSLPRGNKLWEIFFKIFSWCVVDCDRFLYRLWPNLVCHQIAIVTFTYFDSMKVLCRNACCHISILFLHCYIFQCGVSTSVTDLAHDDFPLRTWAVLLLQVVYKCFAVPLRSFIFTLQWNVPLFMWCECLWILSVNG